MLYNETLDIISSSDNKTCDSCVVYIILFSVYKYIYGYICYSFIYLRNRSTNSHHLHCLNINGY